MSKKTLLSTIDSIQVLVDALKLEATAADKGNKSANVRFRKHANDLRAYLFEVRKLALEQREQSK
jgi:hypothetical protein